MSKIKLLVFLLKPPSCIPSPILPPFSEWGHHSQVALTPIRSHFWALFFLQTSSYPVLQSLPTFTSILVKAIWYFHNGLLIHLLASVLVPLQFISNKVAKVNFLKHKWPHVVPSDKILKWLHITLREKIIFIIACRAIYNVVPAYFSDQLPTILLACSALATLVSLLLILRNNRFVLSGLLSLLFLLFEVHVLQSILQIPV